MKKYIFRFQYLYTYDFIKFEDWLTDMSERGFELMKITCKLVIFKKVKPKKITYRIHFYKDDKNSKIDNYYKKNNWYYVTSSKDYYILANTESKIREDSYIINNLDYIRTLLYKQNKYYSCSLIAIFCTMIITFGFLSLFNNVKLAWKVLLFYLPLCFVFLDQIFYNKAIITKFNDIRILNRKCNWKRSYYKNKTVIFLSITYYILLVILMNTR